MAWEVVTTFTADFLAGQNIEIQAGPGKRYAIWTEVHGVSKKRNGVIYIWAKDKAHAEEVATLNGFFVDDICIIE
jgi:hypothetical protein